MAFATIIGGNYGGSAVSVLFEVYLCAQASFVASSACALAGVAREQESQTHYEVRVAFHMLCRVRKRS